MSVLVSSMAVSMVSSPTVTMTMACASVLKDENSDKVDEEA